MRTSRLILAASLLAVAAIGVATSAASAHEHYTAGPYELIVGWSDEPAVVGSVNGLDLGVKFHPDANTTEVVENAHHNLTVTVLFGIWAHNESLEPQFGNPGWYTFDIIPTMEGAYNVHIAGTLNGTSINVIADLEAALARSDIEFPATTSIDDLVTRVTALEAANFEFQQSNARAMTAAEAGRSAASSATLFGMLGVAVGAAGLAAAVVAMRRRPKSGLP